MYLNFTIFWEPGVKIIFQMSTSADEFSETYQLKQTYDQF